MLRQVGRAALGLGKVAGKGTVGGLAFGPVGAAVAMGAKPVRKGIAGAARNKGRLKDATMGLHSSAMETPFMQSHNKIAGATGFMARHPVITGTAVGAQVLGVSTGMGSSSYASKRNQNSAYLRRVRDHQQSSSLSRLVGSSTGAFA